MKTRSDKTISSVMLMISGIFTSIILIKGFNLSMFGWCWVLGWLLLAAFAVWKIESYEIVEDKLIKRNFLGLFAKVRKLNTLKKHSKKMINTDYPTNPLNIVKIFSRQQKYLVYREISLQFNDASRIIIDERTVENSDFAKLYKEIKKYPMVKD